MSIENLFESDALLPGLAIFVIAAVIIIVLGRKKADEKIYGKASSADIINKHAKIITKRKGTNPYNSVTTAEYVNYILFEFDNGDRIELAIQDNNIFAILAEGDTGLLQHSNNKFISFKRDVTSD